MTKQKQSVVVIKCSLNLRVKEPVVFPPGDGGAGGCLEGSREEIVQRVAVNSAMLFRVQKPFIFDIKYWNSRKWFPLSV